MKKPRYICPLCGKGALHEEDSGLRCLSHGSREGKFPFAPNTTTPIFASQRENSNEYTIQDAAQIHDNALQWLFSTFRTTEEALRSSLVRRLDLRPGSCVLITGAGAGNDIPYIMNALGGKGEIYAQDIAKEMVLFGEARVRQRVDTPDLSLFFSVSDATSLPFEDNFFDAAYHFGGINMFADKQAGIAEMNRVVRTGGKILIGDEGLAPWLRETELGRMLINNISLYSCEPPLHLLPSTVTDVELSWELSGSFYVIVFTVSSAEPHVDIDVKHVGKRGGSIRTRYFGQLEGIDPALREVLYQKAEQIGVSRVDLLESLIRCGLKLD